jgi:UDP-N-acetylglucosamine 1-carboxyvinyltransferase
MSYLIINGGRKLRGEIINQSAKNSAEALLCASVMIKGPVVLTDVPRIEGVKRILELLSSIGVKIKQSGTTVHLDASADLNLAKMDQNAAEVTRTSLLLLGALAAREKKYKLYKSGGCHLGERTVRPHLYALQKLGVNVVSTDCHYEVENSRPLRASHIVLYESGDTTTENAIMAAVLAPGVTTLKMASANYQVQDLCHFLNSVDAKISGIGTTTLTIIGVKKLRAPKEYPVMPDPIVAMTFIAAAITTGSNLIIKNCPLEFLELELYKLEIMGQKLFIKNERLSKNGKFKIVDIEIVSSKLTALPDKIYGRPFPGLNIDNLPLFIPILTQARGRTMVHDWAYENRAVYALELQKLGAKITLLDPHRVWVEGPTELVPADMVCPPALRPAVNLLIAMLAASGKSVLRDTHVIDRGYENLYDILNKAGAEIKIVKC